MACHRKFFVEIETMSIFAWIAAVEGHALTPVVLSKLDDPIQEFPSVSSLPSCAEGTHVIDVQRFASPEMVLNSESTNGYHLRVFLDVHQSISLLLPLVLDFVHKFGLD